jgi:hypothetical protein
MHGAIRIILQVQGTIFVMSAAAETLHRTTPHPPLIWVALGGLIVYMIAEFVPLPGEKE